MLCTNGHNNNGDAKFCVTCGVNTFTPGTSHTMATTPTSGLAIASLVLGILWVYWIGSILALVFGYVARKEILAGKKQGQGLATAGIAQPECRGGNLLNGGRAGQFGEGFEIASIDLRALYDEKHGG